MKQEQPQLKLPQQQSQRSKSLLAFERNLWRQGFKKIAGIDEAGRGPLAGPVFACACIIDDPKLTFKGINDSKLLSAKQRDSFFDKLTRHPKVHYGLGSVTAGEIDQINIYQATLLAFRRALEALPVTPDALLVDGMPFSYQDTYSVKIIEGDRKSQSIAAASIIAKVSRDKWMCELDKLYPQYGFAKHKGYGTEEHREKLAIHGPCPEHRVTFKGTKEEKPSTCL